MNTPHIPISSDQQATKALRGPVLTFNSDPFLEVDQEKCYTYIEDALVVIADGRIVAVGEYMDVKRDFPELEDIEEWVDSLILPGLIDTHLHYVQTSMVGCYGDTLLEWLNTYTFPTEMKFSDRAFADEVADVFLRQLLRQGTTTANVFATTYAASVDAFFEASERYGTRMICGKVLMDRNVPEGLRDCDPYESVALSEELLLKWHGHGRQLYAVIPRFAPTSTHDQLRLAGELYQKYIDRGVFSHTHLDEARPEIEWALSLYPDAVDYTDIYDRYGLVGPRSVFAHCCLVEEREWRVLSEKGGGASHCPSSNLFLGGGEFKYWDAKNPEHPVGVGIGTDVGGGTNFSVLRQLGEAYKVSMMHGHPLSPLRSLYLATRGGAEILGLSDTIGSVAPGMEADIAVLDLAPDQYTGWRLAHSETLWEKLFALLTLGHSAPVRATYVSGRKVFDRDAVNPFPITR